jgi:hypothetical protein
MKKPTGRPRAPDATRLGHVVACRLNATDGTRLFDFCRRRCVSPSQLLRTVVLQLIAPKPRNS